MGTHLVSCRRTSNGYLPDCHTGVPVVGTLRQEHVHHVVEHFQSVRLIDRGEVLYVFRQEASIDDAIDDLVRFGA